MNAGLVCSLVHAVDAVVFGSVGAPVSAEPSFFAAANAQGYRCFSSFVHLLAALRIRALEDTQA